jgi:hypothetical protein
MRTRHPLSRRDLFRLAAAGFAVSSSSGWLERLAAAAANDPQRKRTCILLWMNGGPSQLDTFDLKPGHENGGAFKDIATSAGKDVRISEHLPKVAAQMQHLAVVRSMTSKEGDHGRASFLLRTGYLPQGPVQYPSLGAVVSHELGKADSPLPTYVSIAPQLRSSPAAYGAGFLGPQHEPLLIGEPTGQGGPQTGPASYEKALQVPNLARYQGVESEQAAGRLKLLQEMQQGFLANRPDPAPRNHQAALERAVRLMQTSAARAFDLHEEKASLRDAYGHNLFGQGCLLARRLIERGVPFVEVTLGGLGDGVTGWDTHYDNFDQVKRLSQMLDPAWSTLLTDLKDRGLLASTLVVWMGEFGRTPRINQGGGRDHYPLVWSAVLGGGGIKGGQVVGKTSADGAKIVERPSQVGDLLATIYSALGIDFSKQNNSNVGRPIGVVDTKSQPIREVLA